MFVKMLVLTSVFETSPITLYGLKFFLLEVIQVQVMLFCVLKWPARFTGLHFMCGEYILSLDWALHSGKRHPSLSSSDVTHSTVSNPTVQTTSCSLGSGLWRQYCRMLVSECQVCDVHLAIISNHVSYSLSVLCKV